MLQYSLHYEERQENYKTATQVRDVGCFLGWSIARSVISQDKITIDSINELKIISRELILRSLFDREISIRRAAAAALQEIIGRHNPFTIDIGINICQEINFYTITNSYQSYIKVTPIIGKIIPSLSIYIIEQMLKNLNHWDQNIRYLSSKGLEYFIINIPIYCDNIINKVFNQCQNQINCIQGPLFALSNIIKYISLNNRYILYTNTQKLLSSIIPAKNYQLANTILYFLKEFLTLYRDDDNNNNNNIIDNNLILLICKHIEWCSQYPMCMPYLLRFIYIIYPYLNKQNSIVLIDKLVYNTKIICNLPQHENYYLIDYQYWSIIKSTIPPLESIEKSFISRICPSSAIICLIYIVHNDKEFITNTLMDIIRRLHYSKCAFVRQCIILFSKYIPLNNLFIQSTPFLSLLLSSSPSLPLPPDTIYKVILSNLDDHTIDQLCGDVGSWIRFSALKVLKNIPIHFIILLSLDRSMIIKNYSITYINDILYNISNTIDNYIYDSNINKVQNTIITNNSEQEQINTIEEQSNININNTTEIYNNTIPLAILCVTILPLQRASLYSILTQFICQDTYKLFNILLQMYIHITIRWIVQYCINSKVYILPLQLNKLLEQITTVKQLNIDDNNDNITINDNWIKLYSKYPFINKNISYTPMAQLLYNIIYIFIFIRKYKKYFLQVRHTMYTTLYNLLYHEILLLVLPNEISIFIQYFFWLFWYDILHCQKPSTTIIILKCLLIFLPYTILDTTDTIVYLDTNDITKYSDISNFITTAATITTINMTEILSPTKHILKIVNENTVSNKVYNLYLIALIHCLNHKYSNIRDITADAILLEFTQYLPDNILKSISTNKTTNTYETAIHLLFTTLYPKSSECTLSCSIPYTYVSKSQHKPYQQRYTAKSSYADLVRSTTR